MNYKAKTTSAFSPVRLYMRMIKPPSMNATCGTESFALESLIMPLHVPPPIPECDFCNSSTGYTGVPTRVVFTLFNGKATPINNVQITTKVVRDKTTKLATYTSPVFRSVDANEKVTDVKVLTVNTPGTVTLKSEASYRTENTKSTCSVKQLFKFEEPIKLLYEFHGTAHPVCQVRVENLMPQPLMGVCVQVGDRESEVAGVLGNGEVASGFVNIAKRITAVNAMWTIPGSAERCMISLPCEKAPDQMELPAKVTLTKVPKMLACYTPFQATLTVKNMWRTQIEGEIAIEEGVIALFGLNRLVFTHMQPNEEREVVGTFIALREGKVVFPKVKVAIREGQQFTIDVDSGVLVVGDE